jgi:hypothetical protein
VDLKYRSPLSSASIPLLARLPIPLAGTFRLSSFTCVITFTGSQLLQVFSFCCCPVFLQAKLSWVARKAGKHHLTKTIRNTLTDTLADFISLRFHLWRRAPVPHLTRRLGVLVHCQIPRHVGILQSLLRYNTTAYKPWKNTLRSLGALPPTARRKRDRAYRL